MLHKNEVIYECVINAVLKIFYHFIRKNNIVFLLNIAYWIETLRSDWCISEDGWNTSIRMQYFDPASNPTRKQTPCVPLASYNAWTFKANAAIIRETNIILYYFKIAE